MSGPAPLMILNPREDQSFVAFVEQLEAVGYPTPQAMQAALRERYPHGVVRRRELSAEATYVWYIYRDGHWVPPEETRGEGQGGVDDEQEA
jgi:hypothetical protein